MNKIEHTGQMQISLEAALEQLSSVSVALRLMVYGGDNDDKLARYHLDAATRYIESVSNAMVEMFGHTDGQLCPYGDCAHDLAFDEAGWWICPNCKRLFNAVIAEGTEDYHCYVNDETQEIPPLRFLLSEARDLGPSWASKEKGADA